MQEIYRVKTSPVALSDNMIIGEKYRITFLTEALVRLEYSEDGVFEIGQHRQYCSGIFQRPAIMWCVTLMGLRFIHQCCT